MSDFVLMDGGMGMELLSRSANKTPRLWSADYLLSEPELVTQIHRDYIEAGASVITINAYSASYTRMAMVGMQDQVPLLQQRACELAILAREQSGKKGIAIAGCLPPLNGSYRPDLVRDFEVNLEEYRQLAALQAPHVDLYICETMSTAAEARAAAQAACDQKSLCGCLGLCRTMPIACVRARPLSRPTKPCQAWPLAPCWSTVVRQSASPGRCPACSQAVCL